MRDNLQTISDYLASIYPNTTSYRELAAATNINPNSIGPYLTILRRLGVVAPAHHRRFHVQYVGNGHAPKRRAIVRCTYTVIENCEMTVDVPGDERDFKLAAIRLVKAAKRSATNIEVVEVMAV